MLGVEVAQRAVGGDERGDRGGVLGHGAKQAGRVGERLTPGRSEDRPRERAAARADERGGADQLGEARHGEDRECGDAVSRVAVAASQGATGDDPGQVGGHEHGHGRSGSPGLGVGHPRTERLERGARRTPSTRV